MPTRSDASALAGEAAGQEAKTWERVADLVITIDLVPAGPSEASVVLFYDPAADLDSRTRRWGYQLPDHTLGSLARFAGALALAEAAARREGVADVALRAYSDRRRLLGDRIVHWAVPWLEEVGHRFPRHRAAALAASALILHVGDQLRPVPDLTGGEGLYPPGEDSYGPIEVDASGDDLTASLWSGLAPVGAVLPGNRARYSQAVALWRRLAEEHEGTGRLWLDLASRAERTAGLL
jgi:hypothetical protein